MTSNHGPEDGGEGAAVDRAATLPQAAGELSLSTDAREVAGDRKWMIADPLPHEYATSELGIGGRIKVRAEDFLVEEIPAYEPLGEGEHVYLLVQKTNTSHAEMTSVLRRHFGVDHQAIGFAGMKDKTAITRQMVSIHLPGREPPAGKVDHDRISVLGVTRHHNKLRTGQLAGNRFSIRIREVDPMSAPAARRIVQRLETSGVPNYFGAQRFGYRANNHRLGMLVLRGEWRHAASELLGTAGSTFPEYQREKRAMYDGAQHAEAAAQWTTADRIEHIVSKKLARGQRPRDAVLAAGEQAMSFWISALQSAIFNRVLDERLRAGSWTTVGQGDVAFIHASRAAFIVRGDDLAGGTLADRAARFEISPSGPLWGARLLRAEGDVDMRERAALEAAGFTSEEFLALKRCPEGQRRPLRVPLRNLHLEAGVDEHGGYIRLAFDLPRGSYATVVLREIMKNESSLLT